MKYDNNEKCSNSGRMLTGVFHTLCKAIINHRTLCGFFRFPDYGKNAHGGCNRSALFFVEVRVCSSLVLYFPFGHLKFEHCSLSPHFILIFITVIIRTLSTIISKYQHFSALRVQYQLTSNMFC